MTDEASRLPTYVIEYERDDFDTVQSNEQENPPIQLCHLCCSSPTQSAKQEQKSSQRLAGQSFESRAKKKPKGYSYTIIIIKSEENPPTPQNRKKSKQSSAWKRKRISKPQHQFILLTTTPSPRSMNIPPRRHNPHQTRRNRGQLLEIVSVPLSDGTQAALGLFGVKGLLGLLRDGQAVDVGAELDDFAQQVVGFALPVGEGFVEVGVTGGELAIRLAWRMEWDGIGWVGWVNWVERDLRRVR